MQWLVSFSFPAGEPRPAPVADQQSSPVSLSDDANAPIPRLSARASGLQHQEPRAILDGAIRPQLHAYMATVLYNLGCSPRLVGSVEDHVHLLFDRCEPDHATPIGRPAFALREPQRGDPI